MADTYDGLTIGQTVSLSELKRLNPEIWINSVKAVPTENTAPDGSAEYMIVSEGGGSDGP